MQTQAIGVTTANDQFPPAKRMLSDWKTYKAEDLMPPPEYLKMKRKK